MEYIQFIGYIPCIKILTSGNGGDWEGYKNHSIEMQSLIEFKQNNSQIN